MFLAFAAYIVEEFIADPTIRFTHRSHPNLLKAILGIVIIGVPSVLYAVLGRFSISKEPEIDISDVHDDGFESYPEDSYIDENEGENLRD